MSDALGIDCMGEQHLSPALRSLFSAVAVRQCAACAESTTPSLTQITLKYKVETMARRRIETWLAVVVGAVGLGLLALAGLWMYVSATATPLHPNAQDVAP